MENGQRMSLKLYSPALARTAGEKTRESLSDAYAVISPHPFTLGLFHSAWNIYPATGTENDQTDRQIWVSAEQLHCDPPSVPLGTGAQPWSWPQVTPSTQNTLGSPGGASLWTGESTTITTFRPLMDMQSQGHKDNHLNSKFLTLKEKLRKYPHTSTLANYSWSCILKKYWFYSQSVWYISVQRLINSYHRKSKFLKSHRSIVERGVPTEHSHIQMYKT